MSPRVPGDEKSLPSSPRRLLAVLTFGQPFFQFSEKDQKEIRESLEQIVAVLDTGDKGTINFYIYSDEEA